MSTARSSLAAAAAANGKIYALGGRGANGSLATIEEFTAPVFFYYHRKN